MSKKVDVEKRAKKAKIQQIILESVKLAGYIGLTAFAPKVLAQMKRLGLVTHPRQIESVKRSKDKLIKKGLLELKNDQLIITQHGRRYLLKCLSLGEKERLDNKKWDKKWRVIIFDVPETKRFDRNNIRQALVSIGFLRLQNSVWVYPYNCEDLINLLKTDTETEKDVIYMIVDQIENDEEIKKYFGLK